MLWHTFLRNHLNEMKLVQRITADSKTHSPDADLAVTKRPYRWQLGNALTQIGLAICVGLSRLG